MTLTAREPLHDSESVVKAVRLLVGDGQVTELRALNATTKSDRWPHTASGYFDDADKLTAALAEITSAKGIYIVPNPVYPALLARAANRIRKTPKEESTQDSESIHIVAHGNRLRYSPRSAVTPDLAGRMKAHKAALLAILAGQSWNPRNPPTQTKRTGRLSLTPTATTC